MASLLHRCAALVIAAASIAAPALAADNAKLTDMEKMKVSDAIALLEQAWKDCLTMKVIDVMGTGGDNMPYEKIKKDGMDVDPTFQDVINHLKNMLDKDNIVSNSINGWGTVDVQPGVDNDKIVIRKGLLEDLCNAATPAAKKMELKLQLVATLANESMHVFQKWTEQTGAAGRPKLCDGEKDSDMASIKALEPIVNALMDAMGNTHTDLAGIYADPQYVKFLGLCMSHAGATSAADIAKVKKAAKEKLGETSPRSGYKGRKDRFAFDLTPPFTNWATWYYGTSDAFQETFAEADETPARTHSTLVGDDLVTTRTYPVVGTQRIIAARGYITRTGQEMVINLSSTPIGGVQIRGFRDEDDDGLPELAPTFTWTVPTSVTGTFRPLYQLRIIPIYPDTLRAGLSGLTIFDTGTGTICTLALEPNGSSLSPPVAIFTNPALQNSDLQLLDMIMPQEPSPAVRVIFGEESEGSPNIVWFDHFPDNSTVAFMNPGQFFAQAAAPTNTVGIDQLFISPSGGPIRAMGNPFSGMQIASIGRGSFNFMGFNSIPASGISSPFNTFQPIEGNDLFQFFASGTDPYFGYLPRVGANIACAVNDETGDGTPDRLQLSTEPPRLHLLTADLAQPGTFRHVYEIALEPKEYVGFRGWSDLDGRNILIPEELDDFTRFNLNFPTPAYAQRLLDLDGDGAQDDSGVVLRYSVDSFFDVFFMLDVPAGALVTDSHPLPASFEPGDIAWGNVAGNFLPDLVLTDYNTGVEICFQNISTPGNVTFQPCSLVPPCCPGNADKIPGQVNFADVTSVLANFSMIANPNGTSPGDADCNGFINFGDITTVLANFLHSCP